MLSPAKLVGRGLSAYRSASGRLTAFEECRKHREGCRYEQDDSEEGLERVLASGRSNAPIRTPMSEPAPITNESISTRRGMWPSLP